MHVVFGEFLSILLCLYIVAIVPLGCRFDRPFVIGASGQWVMKLLLLLLQLSLFLALYRSWNNILIFQFKLVHELKSKFLLKFIQMLSIFEFGFTEGIFLGPDPQCSGQPKSVIGIQFSGVSGLLIFENEFYKLVILVEKDVDFVGPMVCVGMDILENLDFGLFVLFGILASGLHPLELIWLLGHIEGPKSSRNFGLQALFRCAFTSVFSHSVQIIFQAMRCRTTRVC